MDNVENLLEEIDITDVINHYGSDYIASRLDYDRMLDNIDVSDIMAYYSNGELLREYTANDILDEFDIEDLIDAYGNDEKIKEIIDKRDYSDESVDIKNKILEICRIQSPHRHLLKNDVKEILNDMIDFYFYV